MVNNWMYDKMDELEQLLTNTIEKFKDKMQEDENLRNEMKDLVRTINIELTDSEGFSFILNKGDITDFKKGYIENPDVAIQATGADFLALMKKELKPMKAWATKRLKFEAELDDVVRLRKFF